MSFTFGGFRSDEQTGFGSGGGTGGELELTSSPKHGSGSGSNPGSGPGPSSAALLEFEFDMTDDDEDGDQEQRRTGGGGSTDSASSSSSSKNNGSGVNGGGGGGGGTFTFRVKDASSSSSSSRAGGNSNDSQETPGNQGKKGHVRSASQGSSSIKGETVGNDDLQMRLIDNERATRALQARAEQLQSQEPSSTGRWRRLYQAGRAAVMAPVYNMYSAKLSVPPLTDDPIYLLGSFYLERVDPTGELPKDVKGNNETEATSGELSMARLGINREVTPDQIQCAPALVSAMKGHQLHEREFLADFHSIIQCTYRKGFSPLSPYASHLTSDAGWGCMLRTIQMMVAHTLTRYFLGRDWRLTNADVEPPHSLYRQILRWFSDSDDPRSPYSIHNMIAANHAIQAQVVAQQQARRMRERRRILQARNDPDREFRGQIGGDNPASENRMNIPGEYFSPTRVCQIVKRLLRLHSPEGLTAYVASHGHLVRSKVEALATRSLENSTASPPRSPSQSFSSKTSPLDFTERPRASGNANDSSDEEKPVRPWRPVLILVPVRLGADRISDVYLNQLRHVFRMPQCCGIVGGRPRASLYFVGYQEANVFYLDPHTVQAAQTLSTVGPHGVAGVVDSRSLTALVEEYHTPYPLSMPLADIDPSLAFGFFCESRDSFEHLCEQLARLERLGHPLFHVVDRPEDTGLESTSSEDEAPRDGESIDVSAPVRILSAARSEQIAPADSGRDILSSSVVII